MSIVIGSMFLLKKGRKTSVLCAEFLYRDILRKALSLVQKLKVLKIFTAVYHSSHSLNERKGIKILFHTQDVKIDSLHISTRNIWDLHRW